MRLLAIIIANTCLGELHMAGQRAHRVGSTTGSRTNRPGQAVSRKHHAPPMRTDRTDAKVEPRVSGANAALEPEDSTPGRAAKVLLVLIIASAFGPYLFPGITTVQVVIYPISLFTFVLVMAHRIKLSAAIFVILAASLVVFSIAVIALVTPGSNTSPWPYGNSLANADALLLPMCTLAAVAALAGSWPSLETPLNVVASTMTVAMVVNAAIAVLQLLRHSPSLVETWFWGTGGTGERSLTVGRYTGIFSQPSLAGIAYSLGCLSAIYALRRRPVLQALILSTLIFAGTLTASKVFLLIGLPISLFFFMYSSRKRFAYFLVLVTLASPVIGSRLAEWKGFTRLAALLPGSPDWFKTVTGNRYGADSSTQPLITAILHDHPLSGYGLAGLDRSTDTTYVFILSLAGALGLAAVVVQMLALIAGYWNRRKGLQSIEQVFLATLLIVMLASTFGANALHGNRVSVLVWAIAGLLLIQTLRRPSQVAYGQRARSRRVSSKNRSRDLSMEPSGRDRDLEFADRMHAGGVGLREPAAQTSVYPN